MKNKLLVPDIGDFENVEVIELLVNEGDQLNENDPKATMPNEFFKKRLLKLFFIIYIKINYFFYLSIGIS